MRKSRKIITEEGFALKPYPIETETVSIGIPPETLEVLEIVAKRKDLSVKGLLKFYVGQGLRQDLTEDEARDLALKRMASRKGGKNADVDMSA